MNALIVKKAFVSDFLDILGLLCHIDKACRRMQYYYQPLTQLIIGSYV